MGNQEGLLQSQVQSQDSFLSESNINTSKTIFPTPKILRSFTSFLRNLDICPESDPNMLWKKFLIKILADQQNLKNWFFQGKNEFTTPSKGDKKVLRKIFNFGLTLHVVSSSQIIQISSHSALLSLC